MDKSGKSGNVCRVEDNHYKFYVRAILLDVVTELSSNLAVAFEKVFTGHAVFTGSTTGRDDILCILECNSGVDGSGKVDTGECAVIHLCEHTLKTGLENIIQADVGGEAKHCCGLDHI